MRLMTVLGLAGLLAWGSVARAGNFHGLVGVGLEFGGEELVKVHFSDGTDQSIMAGQGFRADLGLVWTPIQLAGHGLDLQGTVGWKYATIQASNLTVDWTRWPIELLAFYKYLPAHLRLGGGLAFHAGSSLNSSGSASFGNFGFDPAVGGVVQADYTFGDSLILGARYNLINYQANQAGSPTHSGNSFGINLSYLIGK